VRFIDIWTSFGRIRVPARPLPQTFGPNLLQVKGKSGRRATSRLSRLLSFARGNRQQPSPLCRLLEIILFVRVKVVEGLPSSKPARKSTRLGSWRVFFFCRVWRVINKNKTSKARLVGCSSGNWKSTRENQVCSRAGNRVSGARYLILQRSNCREIRSSTSFSIRPCSEKEPDAKG
jgi:hypothetical protein